MTVLNLPVVGCSEYVFPHLMQVFSKFFILPFIIIVPIKDNTVIVLKINVQNNVVLAR